MNVTNRTRGILIGLLWLGRILTVLVFLFWGAFFVEHLIAWFAHPLSHPPPFHVWVGQALLDGGPHRLHRKSSGVGLQFFEDFGNGHAQGISTRTTVPGRCFLATREPTGRMPCTSAANYRGFIQNFLIVDAPNSRVATLSVWETEADARAIYEDEGGLYQTAIAKLKPMLAGPPDSWMGPLTRVDK